ncbi:hypothetical protein BDK51DRAFT_32823, partial [Blyttiomyces helicus]
MFVTKAALLAAVFTPYVAADIYMHNPRGSNDRCDEKNNDRTNANRLWDSQNNAAGGYGTCAQPMFFYEGSSLRVEYTAQHGCGNGNPVKNDPTNPEIVHCQIILQLGCEDTFAALQPSQGTPKRYWDYTLQDGTPALPYTSQNTGSSGSCTSTRPLWFNDCAVNPGSNSSICDSLNLNNQNDFNTFENENTNGPCRCSARRGETYGYHEPEMLYHKCYTRKANGGLFLADQQLNGKTAVFTRQDNNGGNDRHGFECPEERDYYPYWHPTGWRDIAIKTSDLTQCPYYQAQSENVVGRCECVNPNDPFDPSFWFYNNQNDCQNALINTTTGSWVCQNSFNLPPPDCLQHEWQMDNHLGMGIVGGSPSDNEASYDWTIPTGLIPAGQNDLKCTIRLRYNISNANVGFFDDYTKNGEIKTNPVIAYGNLSSDDPAQALPLRLAVNTAQFPRTFQDRSYVFNIRRRPSNITGTIHNLNVRGKRGNIAQVRNCVEYDFVPSPLYVSQGDYVNFQWCGSDYNDPNNDGQGMAGTDRNNIVAISDPSQNKFVPVVNSTVFATEDLQALAWINQTG